MMVPRLISRDFFVATTPKRTRAQFGRGSESPGRKLTDDFQSVLRRTEIVLSSCFAEHRKFRNFRKLSASFGIMLKHLRLC